MNHPVIQKIKTGVYIYIALLLVVFTIIGLNSEDISNAVLKLTYILIGTALLGSLIGLIVSMINKPQRGIKVIIGILSISILFGLSYFLSNPSLQNITTNISAVSLKACSAALIASYICLIVAVVLWIINTIQSILID